MYPSLQQLSFTIRKHVVFISFKPKFIQQP